MNIIIVNGPNLNLLGERESDIYGKESLEELMLWLEKSPIGSGQSFKYFQSNHEGEIIDFIQDERHWSDGIIINPAAFTHYSYAYKHHIIYGATAKIISQFLSIANNATDVSRA